MSQQAMSPTAETPPTPVEEAEARAAELRELAGPVHGDPDVATDDAATLDEDDAATQDDG